MNDDVKRKVKINRRELQALAESDLPAAPVAKAILKLDV
jgi:hypothetical protein